MKKEICRGPYGSEREVSWSSPPEIRYSCPEEKMFKEIEQLASIGRVSNLKKSLGESNADNHVEQINEISDFLNGIENGNKSDEQDEVVTDDINEDDDNKGGDDDINKGGDDHINKGGDDDINKGGDDEPDGNDDLNKDDDNKDIEMGK